MMVVLVGGQVVAAVAVVVVVEMVVEVEVVVQMAMPGVADGAGGADGATEAWLHDHSPHIKVMRPMTGIMTTPKKQNLVLRTNEAWLHELSCRVVFNEASTVNMGLKLFGPNRRSRSFARLIGGHLIFANCAIDEPCLSDKI